MTTVLNSVGATAITDPTDVTKVLGIDLTGATTGTSTTFQLSQTGNRIYTVPDTSTNSQFIMSDSNQTINGIKSFTTPIAATSGGTGFSSYTVGDILTANTTTTFTKLAAPAVGNALISGGVGAMASWGKVDLTTTVTGILPTANGGSGINTSSATNGQLLIGNGSGLTLSTITQGTGMTITNGSGSITVTNAGVLSFSAGTTGLTPNVATTGAVSLAGTLVVGNGGTGQTTLGAGSLLLGNGTSAIASLADVAVGSALTSGGVGANPTWTAFTPNATASTLVSRDTNANTTVNNLINGYTTTVTAGATTTLTVSSTQLQYFTGSTTQTVVMPVTSTLVLGQQWVFNNNSTGTVTIQSSGLNTIVALTAGQSGTVTCVLTSGTSAASWDTNIEGANGGVTSLSAGTTGLTPNTASTGAVTLAGTLVVGNGGTGQTTLGAGSLLLGNGTSAIATLADVATGSALTSGGVGANPTWTAFTPNATASTLASRDVNANTTVNNLIPGYTTTATAAGTTTLTVSSTQLQYFTGSTTQTVVMPVTSTLVLGQQWVFDNNSTGTVTIQSSGLNTIVALAAGQAATVTCILTSGTTAASWNVTLDGANGGVTSLSAGTTGLTPSSASTGAVTLGGTLVVSNGGTGQTTFGTGAILLGNGTSAVASLADVPTGSVLISGGVGGNPSWNLFSSLLSPSTMVYRDTSGNFRVNNVLNAYTTTVTSGGTTILSYSSTQQQYFTGSSNQTVAMANTATLVLGMNWVIVNNSTGTLTVTSSGLNTIVTLTAGQSAIVTCILLSGSTAASWSFVQTGANGGVTSLSAGTTGLTPNTASTGAVTLAGTLVVGNGGTGQTTLGAGSLLLGNGTSAISTLADVAVGSALTSGGVGANPTWTAFTNAATASTLMSRDTNANTTVNSLIPGYTTTATAAGTTTLTVSSTQLQYFTGSTTQTVVMPVTSTLVLGQQWIINNSSTGTVTVQSSGLNTIVALTAGQAATFTCILTSGTTAASWNAVIEGANGGVTSLSAGTTGLTPSSASTGAVTLAGTLVVGNGGTGQTTLGAGSLLLGNGTSAVATLADVATGSALTSGGVGSNPTWTAFTSAATASTLMSRDANANTTVNNLINGYTTTVTSGGTTTLTVSSTYQQFFTGITSHTVVMPVTSTLVLGQQWLLIMTAAPGTLTIQSSGGNLINTIAANQTATLTCVLTSGTSSISWNIVIINGGVTAFSGGSTGLQPNIYSTGLVQLSGTLSAGNGGTGWSNITTGALLLGNGGAAMQIFPDVAVGSVLASGGVNSNPTWTAFDTNATASTLMARDANANTNLNNTINGYTTTVTAAGTTTLTVSSTQQQYFTGSTTQTVVMPVTSTLALGQQWIIVNNSTGTVTVQSSGGNTIISVFSTQSVLVTCILTSGTTAASWNTASWQSAANVTSTNYNYLYDTSAQAFTALANNFQPITTTNPTAITNGWTSTRSVLTCPATGTYLITYNTTFYSTSGSVPQTLTVQLYQNPTVYSVGTASQTTTTITGSGTTFTAGMVGGNIVWNNGAIAYITAFNSTTSLTSNVSQSVVSGSYSIITGGTLVNGSQAAADINNTNIASNMGRTVLVTATAGDTFVFQMSGTLTGGFLVLGAPINSTGTKNIISATFVRIL